MKTSQSPSLPERLKLERPLVVFDIEATGLNKRTDPIVANANVRYEPDGSVEQFAYLLNPGTPIPEEATQIHGITDDDVREAPTFAEMADVLTAHFDGADLAGYNILGYDIQMLAEEFTRAGRTFSSKAAAFSTPSESFSATNPAISPPPCATTAALNTKNHTTPSATSSPPSACSADNSKNIRNSPTTSTHSTITATPATHPGPTAPAA